MVRNMENISNLDDIIEQLAKNLERQREYLNESTRLFELLKQERMAQVMPKMEEIREAGQLSDIIKAIREGNIKRGQIVTIGYRLDKNDKKIPQEYTYHKMKDGSNLFFATKNITRAQYNKSYKKGNAWETSDLNKKLDKNSFKLYDQFGRPLAENPMIKGGITILTLEEYQEIRHEIPEVEEDFWLRSPSDCYTDVVCGVNKLGNDYSTYMNYSGGVRPAFRLKFDI